MKLVSSWIGYFSLALCDGGANGDIAGLDMRLVHFNKDGKLVNIGIAGDYQLVGAPLGTFVTIVKSNIGLLLLNWNLFAQVYTQQSSILSNVQMRAHGNLVSNVNK